MGPDSGAITLVGLTYPFRGGISHYTTMLFKALERDHRVSLISFTRLYPAFLFPGVTQFDHSRVAFGVQNERIIDTLNPVSWLKAFLKIKRQGCRLVVFQWWSPFFGLCFGTIGHLLRLFTRQKVVFICHNLIPHERHWADRFFSRYALSSADRLIAHSERDAESAKRLLPHVEAVCNPHPAYGQFHINRPSRSEAQGKLSVEGKVLLFFGYVRPYKGLQYLLKALPRVLEETDVTLLVAGEFYDQKQTYLDLIRSLGLGAQVKVIDRYIPNEEVEVYFTACDVVILPYVSGTQSGIVQIAYSFDKPVICTSVGGLPDVVVEGQTGFVVNPEDPHALARAILAFYGSKGTDDFTDHIAAYKGRFGWDKLIEAITNV
ncbi:MAG: glycosyltransferase [Deltaproteobacteria bacterium]|nr:glycosyltransferase [Deltaproteobacteria bacterium]